MIKIIECTDGSPMPIFISHKPSKTRDLIRKAIQDFIRENIQVPMSNLIPWFGMPARLCSASTIAVELEIAANNTCDIDMLASGYERSSYLFQSEDLKLKRYNTECVNSMVAGYPFNGNANDASGNRNNCLLNNELNNKAYNIRCFPAGDIRVVTDRFGNTNSSFSYDGASNNVTESSIIYDIGAPDCLNLEKELINELFITESATAMMFIACSKSNKSDKEVYVVRAKSTADMLGAGFLYKIPAVHASNIGAHNLAKEEGDRHTPFFRKVKEVINESLLLHQIRTRPSFGLQF